VSTRKRTRFGKEVQSFLDSNDIKITELAKGMDCSHCMISQALREPPSMESAKQRISEYIKEKYGVSIEP